MIFHVDPKEVADEGDELSIQSRFRSRMKMQAPKCRVVATPNGGKRTAWERGKAMREGLSPGFPDVNVYWPGDLAILEFKDRNGKLSDVQTDWLNWLAQAGFKVGVFRSADTAMVFLRQHGAPFIVEMSGD